MKKVPHQLSVIGKKPLDAKFICETMEEAMSKAYDGYYCYIRSLKKHYKFKEIDYVLTAIPDDDVNASEFATKQELNAKADKSYTDQQLALKSNVGHTHTGYAPADHTHDYIPNSTLPNLATKDELNAKANANHNHDERYSTIGHQHSSYQLDIEALQTLVNTGRLSLSQMNADYITRSEYVQGEVQQYVHPETHPSSMITTTADRRFTSDAEMNSKVDKVIGKDLVDVNEILKLENIEGENTGDETPERIGNMISGATDKTTPVDADSLGLSDSAASNVLKKLTWANLKTALKGYFDTLYVGLTSSTPAALGASAAVGTATTAARADHVHPLPANATTSSSGLMSAADKTSLDRHNRITPQTLTDATNIVWDCNNGLNAYVMLGGNRTLSITNVNAGEYGLLLCRQDATGNRTLTLPANSRRPGGVLPLSTAANSWDILMFYFDGNYFYWTIAKNFQ